MNPEADIHGAKVDQRVRAVAIIPARLDSQRLPRKMLLADTGRCLCVHTALAVRACSDLARVVLATDSPEVAAQARAAEVEVLLTRPDHASGTDRVFEAYESLARKGENAQVIVNVQGDEPDIDPSDLTRLIEAFEDRTTSAATLAAPLPNQAAAADPNVVKVVSSVRGEALYFSRAPIPAVGHARSATSSEEPRFWRHIGVYAFTPAALQRFCSLPRGTLELCENLEQLRWLEAGERMRVVAAARAPHGIDTREDYDRFVARFRAEAHSAPSKTR